MKKKGNIGRTGQGFTLMDHHQLIVYHSHGPQTQVANLILLVHPVCLLSWTFVQAYCAALQYCTALHGCESSWCPKIFLITFQTYVPRKDIPHTLLIKTTNQISNEMGYWHNFELSWSLIIKSIEEQFIRFDILILKQCVCSALKLLGELHWSSYDVRKRHWKKFSTLQKCWWWFSNGVLIY